MSVPNAILFLLVVFSFPLVLYTQSILKDAVLCRISTALLRAMILRCDTFILKQVAKEIRQSRERAVVAPAKKQLGKKAAGASYCTSKS